MSAWDDRRVDRRHRLRDVGYIEGCRHRLGKALVILLWPPTEHQRIEVKLTEAKLCREAWGGVKIRRLFWKTPLRRRLP